MPFVASPSPVRRPVPRRKRLPEELNFDPPSSKRDRIVTFADDEEEEEDAPEYGRGGAPEDHKFGLFGLSDDETGGSDRKIDKCKGKHIALGSLDSEEGEGEEEDDEKEEYENGDEDDNNNKVV